MRTILMAVVIAVITIVYPCYAQNTTKCTQEGIKVYDLDFEPESYANPPCDNVSTEELELLFQVGKLLRTYYPELHVVAIFSTSYYNKEYYTSLLAGTERIYFEVGTGKHKNKKVSFVLALRNLLLKLRSIGYGKSDIPIYKFGGEEIPSYQKDLIREVGILMGEKDLVDKIGFAGWAGDENFLDLIGVKQGNVVFSSSSSSSMSQSSEEAFIDSLATFIKNAYKTAD